MEVEWQETQANDTTGGLLWLWKKEVFIKDIKECHG